MSNQVVTTAQLTCNFGTTPVPLTALPAKRIKVGNMDAANILDHVPATNIKSFGMCSSLTNPTTATATSAAFGVLTPTPCVPVTAAPWVAGSPTVLLANLPALNQTSKCMCTWLGAITISTPGQTTTQIP
ncbi:DUF4280 domain-containing protein [Roseomonas sp. WA12]